MDCNLDNATKITYRNIGCHCSSRLAWSPIHEQYEDESAPVSDLRVTAQMVGPLEAGRIPWANLYIANDSSHTISAYQTSMIGAATLKSPFWSDEEEQAIERSLFLKLQDLYHEDGVIPGDFPPKVETVNVVSVEGKSNAHIPPGKNAELTQQEASELLRPDGSGRTVLYVMTIFGYYDSSGHHWLESCSWTRGKSLYRCSGHNGPAFPKEGFSLLQWLRRKRD